MWWFRGMNRILIRTLEQYGAGMEIRRVFEGGCGTGYLSSLLGKTFGWRMTGIDLSHDGLRHARKYGFTSAAQADLRQIPFASGRLRRGALHGCARALPQGRGTYAFAGTDPGPASGRVVRAACVCTRRAVQPPFAICGGTAAVHRGRLMESVSATGVEVLRCTYLNSLLLPVS